jgi:hypothetical protein
MKLWNCKSRIIKKIWCWFHPLEHMVWAWLTKSPSNSQRVTPSSSDLHHRQIDRRLNQAHDVNILHSSTCKAVSYKEDFLTAMPPSWTCACQLLHWQLCLLPYYTLLKNQIMWSATHNRWYKIQSLPGLIIWKHACSCKSASNTQLENLAFPIDWAW